MTTMNKLIVTLTLLLATAAQAQNGALRLIPFQARLTGADGNALPDGNYVVTFRIYDVPSAGTPCWEEVHQSNNQGIVPVVGGQVNVLLGSLTPIDDPNKDGDLADAISFNPTAGITCDPEQRAQMDPPQNCDCQAPGPRYLGITVGGNTVNAPAAEMVPRHQLVPSFHARHADIADKVIDNAITSNMIKDGEVTQSDIADGSITAPKLNASLEIGSFIDGSIKGVDIAPEGGGLGECPAIGSNQVCNGSLTGADVTINDALGLTGQNIKDGSIDDLDLRPLPSVRVRASTDQTGPEGQELTVRFDLEEWDIGGLHCKPGDVAGDSTCSTNPTSRLVAVRNGLYVISGGFASLGGCSSVFAYLRRTRAGVQTVVAEDRVSIPTNFSPRLLVSAIQNLQAGDYVELVTSATGCGGAFTVRALGESSPHLAMVLVR